MSKTKTDARSVTGPPVMVIQSECAAKRCLFPLPHLTSFRRQWTSAAGCLSIEAIDGTAVDVVPAALQPALDQS